MFSKRSTIRRPGPLVLAMLLTGANVMMAADREKDGDWFRERNEVSGRLILYRELTLHPAPEPSPALKHRLITSDFDRVDGNAAIYYLKAMGFLEQGAARRRVDEFHTEHYRQGREREVDVGDVPPNSWREMEPQELPKEEVREYLSWHSFQEEFLAEAVRRRSFDLDRRIREVENPIMYLLPEIQVMRELVRTQTLRFRFALAENRLQDALDILGQQYAMANHLGQDEFLVSNLVGVAISGIAFGDALYFSQHEGAPNLYWAYAALPDPLVDMQRAYAYEREFLFEQLKVLREVDQTPRPAGYWQDFIDRLIPQAEALGANFGLSLPDDGSPELTKASLVAAIAAAYPGARQFLIEHEKIDRETIDSYPTAQVVILAVKRFHEVAADDYFKWNHVPFWRAKKAGGWDEAGENLEKQARQVGWASVPTSLFLPAVGAARSAQQRSEQQIAMLQTVESLRAYGATHDGELPRSLDGLGLPAPIDPITGQPLGYELSDDGASALITGAPLPGLQYRLLVRFADAD